MPAATDTFRLSTAPTSGRRTMKSQVWRVSWRSPEPSAPRTRTIPPVISTSGAAFGASASAPTSQSCAPLSRPRVRTRLVTVTTGVVSAAPAATLRAAALSDAARSRGTMTASAPQASAVRRHAPRLCGSCTPSSASSSGLRACSRAPSKSSSVHGGSGSMSAATPWCATSPKVRASACASTRSTGRPCCRASSSSSRTRTSSRAPDDASASSARHADRKWSRADSCLFRELEIDQTLDGIDGRHDHPHMTARAQSAPLASTGPGVAVLVHRVLIIAQIVDMQQTVHGNLEKLHEASELDDCRDQTVERLADALAQVRAFEKRRNITIGLVGALLEPGRALPESAQGIRLVAHAAAVCTVEQGFQRAVHDEVGIATNGRCEMCVVLEREPKVTDVRRLINRLRERAHDERLD